MKTFNCVVKQHDGFSYEDCLTEEAILYVAILPRVCSVTTKPESKDTENSCPDEVVK